MNSPVLRKIMTALVAVLLLFYIGYQIFNANYESVKTETAEYVGNGDTGTADVVQADGFVIRKENVISKEVNGVVAYMVEDGGRVSKDGEIGKIFNSQSDAAAMQEIAVLDKQIADLEKLAALDVTNMADQETLKTHAQQKLSEVLKYSLSGDYPSLREARGDLLYTINERQVVIGAASGYDNRIKELKAKRDSLASVGNSVGSIHSPEAGIFISQADGYESIFSYDGAKEITPEVFKQFKEKLPSDTAGTVGKVCGEYTWYFACVMESEDALKFLKGTSVMLHFPFVTTYEVPAVVAAVNQPDKQSEAAVIFECSRMNKELASLRNETCRISADQYSGIRVSQKAIHFETITKKVKDENGKETEITKEVKGVYVLHGAEIQFRQIIPLFSTSSYVICKQFPDENDDLMTKETVQLYDEIVIEGTDLYDGKVVK